MTVVCQTLVNEPHYSLSFCFKALKFDKDFKKKKDQQSGEYHKDM